MILFLVGMTILVFSAIAGVFFDFPPMITLNGCFIGGMIQLLSFVKIYMDQQQLDMDFKFLQEQVNLELKKEALNRTKSDVKNKLESENDRNGA